MTARSRTRSTSNGRRTGRRRRLALGTLALALAIALGAGGAALLPAPRLAAERDPQADPAVPPLTVRTRAAVPQDGYTVERTFQGRVEAARRSQLGFELAGRLARLRVDEGARVAKGDTLATLDTDRLRARRREVAAALDSARADRELARSTLERVQGARDANAVSAQRLDEARERLAAAQARVREAAARLESIDVDLSKSELNAPYDGLVAIRHVDEGDVVSAGQPVIALLQRDGSEVRIGVDADAARRLSPGDVRPLEVGGRTLDAAVEAVLPERGSATRTVDVRFVIDAELGGSLRAGDVATLTLRHAVAGQGVWLPVEALTAGTRGLWAVYTATADGEGAEARTIRRRSVELLHQDGARAFVRGGFGAGDRIVTEGLQRLVPGQTVRLSQPEGDAPEPDAAPGTPTAQR
jgi:RND family efflux transporter MFP subunit